jgi:hypothetical protein
MLYKKKKKEVRYLGKWPNTGFVYNKKNEKMSQPSRQLGLSKSITLIFNILIHINAYNYFIKFTNKTS